MALDNVQKSGSRRDLTKAHDPARSVHPCERPFSDPGLFIDFCFGRRALLFDLGDLTPLSPRLLFRVSHVFVSHAHIDHFVGFDRLLRVCLHRTNPRRPGGFCRPPSTSSKPIHWTFSVKIHANSSSQSLSSTVRDSTAGANFTLGKPSASARCRQSSCRPERFWMKMNFGSIASCSIMARTCLAFAFEEKLRVNVWSEGLKLRLRVGPWLRDAKRAVRRGAPDDVEIVIRPDQSIPLGVLGQHALRTARGQKFAYGR